MADTTAARRYAAAIFSLAFDANAVDEVGNNLRAFRAAIYDDEATKQFFLSPVIDRREKEKILAGAFSGKANQIALHALLLLVRKRRESLLHEIVNQYEALAMQARGEEPLTVTAARTLLPDQSRRLVRQLENIYGKRFDVAERVDPKLIGGVRVMMGDRRIDGSVEGRLQALARTLYAKN